MRPILALALALATALLLGACQPGGVGGGPAAVATDAPASRIRTSRAQDEARWQDCIWPAGRTVGRITPNRYMDMPIQRLPAIRILMLERRSEDPNPAPREDMLALAPLPDGGVATMDLCEWVFVNVLEPDPSDGGPVIWSGRRLRPSLDIAADYPNLAAEIARRGQLRTIPAGCYAAFDMRSGAYEGGYAGRFAASPERAAGRPTFGRRWNAYIPVSCP